MDGALLNANSAAIVILLLFLHLATPSIAAVVEVEVVSPERASISAAGQSFEIPYESSQPLDAHDPAIDRLIIVVHGSDRNSGDYLDRVQGAIALMPSEVARTLIVAPQFLEELDVDFWGLGSTMLFWSGGWRTGSKSLDTVNHPRPERVSSFAVVDQLVTSIVASGRFPNLAATVLVGHSAGGQFVNRFTAGSPLPEQYSNLQFRFIVANPGTYLYVNSERAEDTTGENFAIPNAAAVAACPGYDEYKYGLLGLNSYLGTAGEASLRDRLESREVIYLLGDRDTGVAGLDLSCEAMMQGTNRFERGSLYYEYLAHFFGVSVTTQHTLSVVPGIGHSSTAIFESPVGLAALSGVPTTAVPGLSLLGRVALALIITVLASLSLSRSRIAT